MNSSRGSRDGAPVSDAEREEERLRGVIAAQTRVLRPPLCPEVEIHGADDYAAIWSAAEAALEALRIAPPFWAFAWAGGQALARHLLDHPEIAKDRAVLAIAAGAGLEALAAARCGARRAVANDIDPAALVAARLNAARNGLSIETCGADLIAGPASGVLDPRAADLILLADALYEKPLAAQMLGRLAEAAAAGAQTLIADGGRGCLTESGALVGAESGPRLVEVARYEVPVPEALEDQPMRRVRLWRLAGG